MDIEVRGLSELPKAAANLLNNFPSSRIFLFFGEMGVGKTTFIKAICKELGVTDTVSSPSYSIINEYRFPDGRLYHFDFYRLKNETEALDMGCEEYFYNGNYCLIEWPEKIANLWPEEFVKVKILPLSEQERQITATVVK